MGTIVVSLILIVCVALIITSMVKKHRAAKKSGTISCSCGCSGCSKGCCK